MNWLSCWEVSSVLLWLESDHPEPSVFRQPVCVCVCALLRFFFDAIRRPECARHGGAAWLTSCAPVSHRPSQWLPFTEVSVTTDLLSLFDLIVAQKRLELKPLPKAIYWSPGMPEPALWRRRKHRDPTISCLIARASSAWINECIKVPEPTCCALPPNCKHSWSPKLLEWITKRDQLTPGSNQRERDVSA